MAKIFLSVLLLVLLSSCCDTRPPVTRYVITDHGAVGDGTTLNTKAIQSTIDLCAANGGGVLVVPPGTFLTGALFFKQGVNLLVEKDGVLKSTTSMADFPPIYTRWEGIERYWTPALLNFIGMTHVTVSGDGLIDGSGEDWPSGMGRGTPRNPVRGGGRGGRGGRGGFGRGGAGAGNFTAGFGGNFTRGPAVPLPTVAEAYPGTLPSTSVLSFAPDPAHLPRINAAGVALPGMGGGRGGRGGFGTGNSTATAEGNDTAAAPGNDPTANEPAPASGVAASTTPAAPRNGLLPPRTLVFQNCSDVHVSNLNFLNEAKWCVVFIYTDHAVAENLTVRNPDHNIPSSDGMDIDSCSHVLVTGCYFECDDDCLSIKSGRDADGLRVNRPCEYVVIEKTHFAYGQGGAAMGSETSGGIRHVIVRDCLFDDDNWAPIRFKSQPSRGGVVEDITYSNITLHNTRQAVEFNLEWAPGQRGGGGGNNTNTPNNPPPAKVLPVVRDVKIINVNGDVRSVGVIHGLPGSPIENVVFQNCTITANTGLHLSNTQNLDLTGLHLTVANGDPIIYGPPPPPILPPRPNYGGQQTPTDQQ
jgi:polygalacturonase